MYRCTCSSRALLGRLCRSATRQTWKRGSQRSVCLLVDDADVQPTMARLPMGACASAVRWSPDGAVLAVAVGGSALRSSSAAGRYAHATSAHLAERGSGQGHMRSNEAEDKAAVLLFSASGAGITCAAQHRPHFSS